MTILLLCLLSIFTLAPVSASAPLDCNTPAGFQRLFDSAAAVVKATPLVTTEPYCGTNLSQFTVQSVVRATDAETALGTDQKITVFATSDTPGLYPVATDQGSVLLLLFRPSDFAKPPGQDCGPFPAQTFSLLDCGGAIPLDRLKNDQEAVLSTRACGAPDDACMNEENWGDCRRLHDGGCNGIAIMESCPLQFVCQDMCCKMMPQCGEGLFESKKPCTPGEDGCTVAAACCSAVYCRRDEKNDANLASNPVMSVASVAVLLLVRTMLG